MFVWYHGDGCGGSPTILTIDWAARSTAGAIPKGDETMLANSVSSVAALSFMPSIITKDSSQQTKEGRYSAFGRPKLPNPSLNWDASEQVQTSWGPWSRLQRQYASPSLGGSGSADFAALFPVRLHLPRPGQVSDGDIEGLGSGSRVLGAAVTARQDEVGQGGLR